MPTTLDEIERFSRFAQERVHQSDPPPTLEECLEMWRAEREREETVASIRRGKEDIAAGRSMSLEEMDRRIRQEFGYSPRQP
jgi:predicted transcriptional regulator